MRQVPRSPRQVSVNARLHDTTVNVNPLRRPEVEFGVLDSVVISYVPMLGSALVAPRIGGAASDAPARLGNRDKQGVTTFLGWVFRSAKVAHVSADVMTIGARASVQDVRPFPRFS